MSLFGNLKNDGLEETQDRLGGGFGVKETAIYTGVVKALYAGESQGGAQSVTLILGLKDGSEYRETFYVTNKKKENFFLNRDDNSKKVPLPGFTIVDDICLVTSGAPLADQQTEDKVVKIWDTDAKKELPKSVPMLVDVLGKELSLGVLKVLEDKTVKNQTTGEYEPNGETREVNVVDKVFHTETRMTVVEAREGADTAKFWDSWSERNNGKVRDKRKNKDGQAGKPGAPRPTSAPAAGAEAKKSLFQK
jgi:hypothetical protein